MSLSQSTTRLLLAGALVVGAGASVPAIAAVAGERPAASATASDSIIDVNKDNIAKVKEMGKTKPVVFLVTAPSWCGACKQLDPIIRKINAADNGKWILAIVDEDKSGGAEKEFSRISGIPTEIPWGKDGEMSKPGRKVGAGTEATHRKWIDDVLAAYGSTPAPTTTAPAPTTPAPVPTTTRPVPTTPAPVPTTTRPVPTTPAPVPTTTMPVPTTPGPVPTTMPVPTTPGPVPTTSTPAPTTPAPTTTVPAPDGAVITISNEEELKAALELSKTKPVVLRIHLDKSLPVLSGENGAWAAEFAAADGGRWTLANIELPLAQALAGKYGIPLTGMPQLTVLRDGKVVGESLNGHSSKEAMRAWLDANAK